MEITKSQLLEVAPALDLPLEEIKEMDSQIFHIVTREKLHHFLATVKNQRKEIDEQAEFITGFLTMGREFSEMVDFRKPMKAAAKVAQIMQKPEKFVEKYGHLFEGIEKYNEKQLTDGKEKK